MNDVRIIICKECGNTLKGHNQKKYCSTSCAAKYNNKHFVKRKRVYAICKGCNGQVYPKDRKYCEKCKKEGRNNKYGKHLNEYTIEEICVRNGSNRYDNIRNHANRLYKNRTHQCEKCSYDKHTEICHIKPISSFSKDTKVGVVNGKQNIMFLCPNCHWEHDNELKK